MKARKRFFALLLTLCMVVSMLPTAVLAASPEDFGDFPAKGHWAYAALEAAVENGLMNGDDAGALNPGGYLKRAELAAVINRAFGAAEKADISGFSDVPASAWYYGDIAKAVAMGTFTGDSGGTMRPEANITRQEAFAVLARALMLEDGALSSLSAFSDKDSVDAWAKGPLAALAAAGYISGSGGKLNPMAYISRQEFAQLMFNLITSYLSASGTVTTLASGNTIVSAAGVTLKDLTVNGDLIISDGVGSGGVTLDGVTVTGRIVIRGGGSAALSMTNNSSVAGEIIAARAGAGIAVDSGSTFAKIRISANNISVTAKSGTVTAAAGVTGATVNGEALAAGESTEIGGSSGGGGGGGIPPTPIVATTSLTITPPTAPLTVGTGLAALTVTRNSGANDAVTWESNKESVVKADSKTGRLSAVGVGEAVISAESASGIVGSVTVYVVNPSSTADLADYTITEPGTVLENCSFTKLTIAASVGAGEVTLRNVTADELIVSGGGENSVMLEGGSYASLEVERLMQALRIRVSEGVAIPAVYVQEIPGGYPLYLETKNASTASIGSVTAAAPLTIVNSVIPSVSTSANLTVTGSSVGTVATTGTSAPTVELTGSTVNTVSAGASATKITGDSAVPTVKVTENKAVTTEVTVGTITASSGASVTANAAVSSVTGAAGSVSLNNSGSTAVTASADSVSVSGESKPTVSGAVPTVTVAANSEGTSGVTVTGTTTNINTTGTGSVGEISIGGSASPTVSAATPVNVVSVSDSAAPTVNGTANTIVSTSSGEVKASGATTENVLAANGSTVQSEAEAQIVTPVLQYIAITSRPVKTEYSTSATELDAVGLVVTGYYTVPGFEGTVSKAITVESSMLTGFSQAAGTHEITVTYSGKTAKFNVTVVAKTLDRIAITTMPTKKTYDKVNNPTAIDTTGIVVTAYYTSALYAPEAVTASCSAVDFTTGAKTVTVTYGSKTTTFAVNVIDSAADAFALAKSNAKAEFLTHFTDTLLGNDYSETGKAAMKKARDAGIAALEALTYPGKSTTDIAATFDAEKGKVEAILTQDEEWTAAASEYKTAHSVALGKTNSTVAVGDKANVSAALNAYAGLVSGVQAKLTTEKNLLDGLLTKIAQLEAVQTLGEAQASAKATLASALSGYSTTHTQNLSGITGAKTAGDTAIEAAATVSAVTSALDDALAKMAAFKSDAVLLAEAKTAAINEINAYLPNNMTQTAYAADYNATGKAQIADKRAAGVAAINAAAGTGAVTSALEAAKADINAVKTAATMAAEALAAAKTAAVTELTNYGDRTAYREAQQAAFDAAKTTGASNITAAADTAAVTTALRAAKTNIDAIKTAAQLTASELAAAKTAAKAALKTYKAQTDYSVAGWQLVQGKVSAWGVSIDACAAISDVTAAVISAKAEIDAITTAEGETTANGTLVAAAKTALENATYAAAAQANIADAAAAKAEVELQIAANGLPAGLEAAAVTVVGGTYTAPTAGTADAPLGTNGSYTFIVTIEVGSAPAGYGSTSATATTSTLTLPITATAYTGTSNEAAVAAAKTAVQGATYAAVAQASYGTETAIENNVKGIAETAAGTDITVSITRVSYTAPIAGTLADLDGTAGSYTFTVTLTKGAKSATTGTLSLAITARAYVPNPSVAVTPASASVDYMGGATLTAAATDIIDPTYQWYKAASASAEGVAIESATSATLTLSDLTATAYYYCKCGETKSNTVTVTVAAQGASATPTAAITGLEASYTLPTGVTVTLAVTPAATYSYKWEKSIDSGTSWTEVNLSSNTLALGQLAIGMNGYKYRCTVTNTETNKLPVSATSAVVTLNIQKGTQTAPALTTNYTVTQPAAISGKGTIGYVAGTMQYRAEAQTAWSGFSTSIGSLEPGKYYVRFAEDDDYSASEAAEITITAFIPGKEAVPTATFAATGPAAGTLTGVASGMKYSVDGGTSWVAITGTSVSINDVTTTNGVKVYMPGNGTTTTDSDVQNITVTKAEAPMGLAGENASFGKSDGRITGVTAAMEYVIKPADPLVYTACTGAEITGLAAGTYLVRVKAAGTVLASADAEVTVGTYPINVNGTGYGDLQTALNAAGTEYPVEVVGSYTIKSTDTVTIGAKQNVNVKSGGDLTNLGTMNIAKGSANYMFTDNGNLRVEYGGTYSGHGITVGSTDSVDFKLLAAEGTDTPENTDDDIDAGYVLLCGATGDCTGEYPNPFLVPGGNVVVPEGRTVTVSTSYITTFDPDNLYVSGTLTSAAFNAYSGVITVRSGGSFTAANADQTASGPMYFAGDAKSAGEPGGGVIVVAGGSYTERGQILFGTSGAVFNLSSGSAAILGAPADSGEEKPFIFLWGNAEVGAAGADIESRHLVVDSGATLTIPSGTTLTIGSSEIRGASTDPAKADGKLINNGTLILANSMQVEGEITNAGTIDASGSDEYNIYLFGYATLNNSGTIKNHWQDDENSSDTAVGWFGNCVLLDFSETIRTTAQLTNTGTIDSVHLNCYVADTAEGDIIPTVTGEGKITQLGKSAVVRSTAALKRAIADTGYNEYNPIGEQGDIENGKTNSVFTLTESIIIANGKSLTAPAGWYDGTTAETCSFTVQNGATLTNNGSLDFNGNLTVAGAIENNGWLHIGSFGDTGKHLQLNGTLTNNGDMELDGQNALGTMAIHSPGSFTNSKDAYLYCHGYLVTNSNEFINNGTVDIDFDYGSDESAPLVTGLTGYSAYSTGENTGSWNGTAFVRNGKGLYYASENYDKISRIYIITEDKAFVKTMTADVTIRSGVTLYIPQDYSENNGEAVLTPYELVVPSGITLTINGELIVSGKLTVQSGGTVTGTGTITKQVGGVIDVKTGGTLGITPSEEVEVSTQAAFETAVTAALAENSSVSRIILKDDGGVTGYTLTGATISRSLSITSEYDGDWDKAGIIKLSVSGLTVNAGVSFGISFLEATYSGATTVSGTLGAGPGESYNTGTMTVKSGGKLDGGMSNFYNEAALTVEDGGSIVIERGREFVNRDGYNESDVKTSDAVLAINEGASMTVASAGSPQSGRFKNENGAELVNAGTINAYSHLDSNGGTINNSGTINAYGGLNINDNDFTNPGTLNNYSKANLTDLARTLVNVLGGRLDELTQQLVLNGSENDDLKKFDALYTDWGDFEGDWDGEYAVALLLKNGVITRSDGKLNQYETISRGEVKTILETLATKLDKTVIVTTAIMDPVDGDTSINSGSIGESKNNTEQYVPGYNELRSICEAFCDALGMESSVNVADETALTAALGKTYVNEIHITADISITTADLTVSRPDNMNENRVIIVDAGKTLTVDADKTLDIREGVGLELANGTTDPEAAPGKLVVNGSVSVFGWINDNGDYHNRVTVGASGNLYIPQDVMEFGKRLKETVGTRLVEAEVNETTIALGRDWPSNEDDPDRLNGYVFLVAYAGETVIENGDDDYWEPYRKISYGEAKAMLLEVYNAIVDPDVEALPTTVTLNTEDWEPEDSHCLTDDNINTLLNLFAAVLPAMPKTDDTTETFTVGSVNQNFSNKNYTNAVTISYSGTPDGNGWGGEIKFESCTFAAGVTINYSDAAQFAVDFGDSCDLGTDKVVTVSANGSTTLWANKNVEIRGAKGLGITANAPVQVSCGSNQSFTLNGVTVSGTYGNTQDENWFNAAIRYNCDAEHGEGFDWTNNGDHTSCTMTVNSESVAATTSPELHLSTGTDGTITVSGTDIAYNVRVHGDADVSGLSVASGNEIALSDNQRPAVVDIGANTVYIHESHDKGYTITGTGTVNVRNNQARVSANGKSLGVPHVFGYGDCQIFVGVGSAAGLTFKVEQGAWDDSQQKVTSWTELTGFSVDAADGNGDGVNDKLHISKGSATPWITDPYQIRLTITDTDGLTVIYEQLERKEDPATRQEIAQALYDEFGQAKYGLAAVTAEDRTSADYTMYTDINDAFIFVLKNGLMTATGETTFGTDGEVTRTQLVNILNPLLDKGRIESLSGNFEVSGTMSEPVTRGEYQGIISIFASKLILNDGSGNILLAAANDYPPQYDNVTFAKPVIISSGTVNSDGWGGDIRFNGCTFVQGVIINYSDAARFAVDFGDSCTVTTGGVSVAANGSTTLWANKNVEIRGAKGLVITANAPAQVSCGSGNSFTLNGVTVSGTGNTGENDYFNAAIRYNCDGNHNTWTEAQNQANDHSGCTMSDGTTATTSPELHLSTGTYGTITVSGTGIAYNVRVHGAADISGLSVASGKEIALSDNDRPAIVNIGANTVYIHDANSSNGGYTITGTENGTVNVQNNAAHVTIVDTQSSVKVTYDLGVPNVFGSSGSYQIYVGIGSKSGLTFAAKQGNTDFGTSSGTTPNIVVTVVSGTPDKLHLSQGTATSWITDPDSVKLTVSVDFAPTVVYQSIQNNTTPSGT